jgi:DNA helicase-2/ATP-dependent DNA helicase PcrA
MLGYTTQSEVSMNKLTTDFKAVYQRLNQAQRRAVDTVEGPVLVIAGPGTGKTEILAARIANILLTTDAAPENILCLTYTDAGTVAMRSRLLQFIGPNAYRVDIFTFHAFCNLVIQEQADHFGLRNLTTISELEQFRYVREIIDAFPHDHPLTRSTGDIHFESDRLLALYEIMKKEDWSADWLAERVDAYAVTLPDNPDFLYKRQTKGPDGTVYKKGDLNGRKLREELRKLEQVKAAAQSFDDYQQLLKERGRYDFADMILWCSAAFRENPDLLATCQERYLYLLVDEFQDTSGSQFELLMQLADYWDAPNLFVVGDDDQSIFRFQGASIENIRRFVERFRSSLTTVTLTDNHRSSQLILDVAGALIARNQERLSDEKQLVAMNPEVAALPEPPRLEAYATIAHETVSIANQISTLLDDGVLPEKIAVIYRNHSQSEEIIRYLTGRGVPVQTRRRADILQEPLILKLLTVLRYLATELERPHSGERLLFEILHEPWFGVPPLALARLSVEIARHRTEKRPSYWREQLPVRGMDKGQQTLFPSSDDLNLRQAGQTVEELLRDAATMTLQELLHHVITRLGILALALSAHERVWHLELLNTLFDFVREETAKGTLSLADLLAMLADMQQQGISLRVEKLSYTGAGVNFLTAHGSKGLQFDYVFMLGCTRGVWDSASRSRTYSMPPTVWSGPAGSEEEESRRLFYVAMTRARKRLVVSWPERDNKEKELEKSRFVAELVENGAGAVQQIVLSDAELLSFGGLVLQAAEPTVPLSLIDEGFVDSLLQKYSLSVTHLNSYLRCPVSFYFNTLLRVPAPMNAAMTFGSAVHYALEQLFRKMKADPNQRFPATETFVDDFRWFMRKHETGFTPVEFRRRLEYGEAILPGFYADHKAGWHHDALVEYPFRTIVMDGVPLNGKLDMLEFSGSHVTVVDYKTGNPQNARKKLRPPDSDKAAKAEAEGKEPAADDLLGGDYWRQAVFYRILVESEPRRNWSMSAARFEFVEPEKESGEFKSARFEVSDDEVELVKEQIRDVYTRIQAKQFSKGCNKPECEWCSFVKRFVVASV